jgi:hypothetical protein
MLTSKAACVLIAWGDNPTEDSGASTFQPPRRFSYARPAAINILNTPVARSNMAYFAVTSNTAVWRQRLFFGFDSVRLEGYLALMSCSSSRPYFIVEISAGIAQGLWQTVFGIAGGS